MKNAMICGALTLLTYAIASVAIIAIISGEVAPSAFVFGLVFSPVAFLIGAVTGRLMPVAPPGKVIGAGLLIGLVIPPVVLYVVAMATSVQHNQRNAALTHEAVAAMDRAKVDGFPFPPDARPFLPGDVRSALKPAEVIKFYDSHTKGTWLRHKAGGTVWYVRKSRTPGMVDRIHARAEYNQTTINFGTYSPETMKLQVAGSFGSLIKGKDWAGASALCSPELRLTMTPTALKSKFMDVEPDSTGFVRKYFPNGATAPIAVNGHIRLGPNTTRSSEVGFELTDDLIPQIKRIEF